MKQMRELLLIGGGHTHALVLHEFAQHPLPRTQITLLSDVEFAPYSGMLPGHIAGLYTHEEMHIDLPALCKKAGAHFIRASVTGLDLSSRGALVDGKQMWPSADFISINVGSTPDMHSVPGVAAWAVPSKPVPKLLAGWEHLKAAAKDATRPLKVLVVGGGAGGVELTLAMQSQMKDKARFTIVHSGSHVLSGHTPKVRSILEKVLRERGIEIRLDERVTKVEAETAGLQSGDTLPADFIFWVTQPTPPAWLRQTGLALTDDGFIRVRPSLETLHHPWVFAAGDVATIEDRPTPKSGVYAVRMAKPLAANLRAVLGQEQTIDYQPQKNILSIIGTADGKAVASHRFLAHHSALMWKWKDWIDRRFMAQFR